MSEQIIVSSLTWRSRAKTAVDAFINFIFPPVCIQCNKVGTLFCEKCCASLQWLCEPLCACCGAPAAQPDVVCANCRKRPLPLRQIRAAVLFAPPITEAIHKMKYNGYFAVAQPLAQLLIEAWPRWAITADLVIPIPLHPDREKSRGYNQSALLARHFSQALALVYDEDALKRVRHTPPQVGLSAAERQENVNDAFWANPQSVAGRRVLLIDDVCTTGSTLAAAAEALRRAGASAISGYCVARAA